MNDTTTKWKPELYNEKHSFVYQYGESLIKLLDPKENQRIFLFFKESEKEKKELYNKNVNGGVNGKPYRIKEKGCFFSGEVLEIRDDNYHIHYDFSGDAWVRKDQVFLYQPPSLSDLQPNTQVFIGLDSGGKWAPGRIQENRNGQFLVRLDDKNLCGSEKPFNWATIDMLILRR